MTHTKTAKKPGGVMQPMDQPMDQRMAQTRSAWKLEAQALGKPATPFGPLTKPKIYQHLTNLPASLRTVEAK